MKKTQSHTQGRIPVVQPQSTVVQPSPFIIAPNVVSVPNSKGAVATPYMPNVKSLLIPASQTQSPSGLKHDAPSHVGMVTMQQNRIYSNPVHVALTKYGKVLIISGSGNDDKGLFFQASLVDPFFKVAGATAVHPHVSKKDKKSSSQSGSFTACTASSKGEKSVKHGVNCECDGVLQHQVIRDYSFRSAIATQYNTTPPGPLLSGPKDLYFNSEDMPPSTKGLGYDMFGSGFGILENCEVLITSGVEIYDIFKSTTRCSIWNPHTNEFRHAGTLRIGRWYPTSTTLPSGHLFTIGGLKGTKDSIRYNSTNNTNTDIFDPYAVGYDRGDNMIDPETNDYWKEYKTQGERMNGDGDTAAVPMKGLWMKHSLAKLVESPANPKVDGIWQQNDQNTEINAPGTFVPGPYQRFQINSSIWGNDRALEDPQVSYHGRGSEHNGAADGNNYDEIGQDYSPLHNDVFSAVPVSIRDSHMLNGTPLFQSAVAEDAEQPRVDMYPRQHLLKDGNVFISGWEKETWEYHPNINKYDNHQDSSEKRIFGTSILLPLNYDDPVQPYRERVLILGGLPSYNRNIPASYTTEFIDLTKFEGQNRTIPKFARGPDGKLLWQQWRQGPSFKEALDASNLPRVAGDNGEMVQQNATILPDGTVLIQGGSRIDEIIPTGRLETFIYTPDDKGTGVGTMKRTADVAVQRQYHGIAILLPDATVGIYGGNPLRGYNEKDIEIFEPKYLFDSNDNRIPECQRPAIKNLNDSPDVRMSGEDVTNYLKLKVKGLKQCDKVKVSLVRLGAVTHAFNSEQRMLTAKVTDIDACGKSLIIELPKFVFHGYNADHSHSAAFTPCPPGCYMVFVFVNGVPSHGKIIRLIRSTGDIHH